jgi:hypothetical protein
MFYFRQHYQFHNRGLLPFQSRQGTRLRGTARRNQSCHECDHGSNNCEATFPFSAFRRCRARTCVCQIASKEQKNSSYRTVASQAPDVACVAVSINTRPLIKAAQPTTRRMLALQSSRRGDPIYGRCDARPNMAVFAMYKDGLIGGIIYDL